MTEYVASAELRRGQLKVRNKKGFDAAMATFQDGEYTVTIERKRATRSAQQNSYYWGVVLALLSEHTGYSADELHEYFKKRFNGKRMAFADPSTGEIKDEDTIGQSTAKLNKVTFGDYLKEIIAFADAELGVVIPPADPDWQAGVQCQNCPVTLRRGENGLCEDCLRQYLREQAADRAYDERGAH